MKRQLIAALVLMLAFSALAVAGPTIGLGVGYYPDTIWFAPSVGIQWLGDPVGIESNLHLAMVRLMTGDTLEVDLAGLWEVFTMTYLFPGDPDGLQWRAIGGIGAPFDLESDPDAFVIAGINPGFLLGISCEWPDGSGVKVLAFADGEQVGVGITAYIDLFDRPEDEG